MNNPLIPDVVERVIYQSTMKLTFNMFYKGISYLDGMGLVATATSTSTATSTGGGSSTAGNRGGREIQLRRVHRGGGGGGGGGGGTSTGTPSQQQEQEWKSFKSTIDLAPLQELAETLIKNKAINQSMIPDHVEQQMYLNCLQIIFWVLHLITTNIKVTFCGHTIGLSMTPRVGMAGTPSSASSSTRGGPSNHKNNHYHNRLFELVTPATIQDVSHSMNALLDMDDGDDDDDDDASSSKNRANKNVKDGLAWMKASLTKMQLELVGKLNLSLYGLILAIVEDLLQSTKIQILSDEIGLSIQSSSSSSSVPSSSANGYTATKTLPLSTPGPAKTKNQNNNNINNNTVDAWTVHSGLAHLEFAQERALLQRRFQEWTPEQRAMILDDLYEASAK
jgi:hypothetical protein